MSQATLLTPPGWDRLRAEHQSCWARRHLVVEALSAAAAEGDRSENAEYIYRKKELRELDRRLRYLGRLIDTAQVIREPPADCSKVRFAAHVHIQSDSGEERRFQLVSDYEADPAAGLVNWRAPLARALIGKQVDDEVDVALGAGQSARVWTILAVDYQAPGGAP